MFENNTDLDFDDNLRTHFDSDNSTKRSRNAEDTEPKKLKITESSPFFKRPSNFPKNVVKRKFPGPAGVLPDYKDVDLSVLEDTDKDPNDVISCSQASVNVFQNEVWQRMCKDFQSLANNYDINWIKLRARTNKLVDQKAPFLAAVIHNIECLDGKLPFVNVILKDPTGEIQGTIIHNLYEEYGENLTTGSVIVLKQFGVLTTGNNHHLTITANNLINIYSKTNSSNNSELKVVRVQDFSYEEIAESASSLLSKKVKQMSSNRTMVTSHKINTWDDLQIPDNFEENIIKTAKETARGNKKFNFRKVNVSTDFSRGENLVPKNFKESVGNKNFKEIKTVPTEIVSNYETVPFSDLEIPDNFEEDVLRLSNEPYIERKKFNFKKSNTVMENISELSNNSENVVSTQSQLVVPVQNEHSDIWQNALEGLDVDALFGDF